MTVSTTANSTEASSTKLPNATMTSASLSAVVIGGVQLLNLDSGVTALLSTSIPICVAAIVYGIQWLFVFCGIKPVSVMRSELSLDKLIKYYRAEIKEEKTAGRDVSALEAALSKALLARGKLFEDEASRN